MGKKQQVIEEISDDEFDGNFSDEDEAPVALNKKQAKQTFNKAPQKQIKDKKQQKAIKKNKKAAQKVEIRGADIFAQELPKEAIKDIERKIEVKEKKQQEQLIVESKQRTLEKRNAKVEKKQQKNPKHIIFMNKKTGKQYMLANNSSLDILDPINEDTSNFIQEHMNRLKRVSLNSIL